MNAATERVLAAPDVQSLLWDGDTLVDVVAGGVRYELDGAVVPARTWHPYRFDAAILSPSRQFAVLYERLGTKALLLRAGDMQIVRELSRSYYFAHRYEYPIAFVALPDGREGLAHCPRSYCRIDIEVAATGECLTDAVVRQPQDVFHSRLAASPGGAALLSAGWCWHPYGAVCAIDLAEALVDPTRLDVEPLWLQGHADVDSATWLADDQLAIATVGNGDTDVVGDRLWKWDVRGAAVIGSLQVPAPPGTLHALVGHGVLALFGHARLLDPATGTVLREWPHLRTGTQRGAILRDGQLPPPCSVHATRPWFAVAGEGAIHVVQMHE